MPRNMARSTRFISARASVFLTMITTTRACLLPSRLLLRRASFVNDGLPLMCLYSRYRRSSSDTTDNGSPSSLEWESFEFSESPKWDTRFDGEAQRALVASNDNELQEIAELEAAQDRLTAQKLDDQLDAFASLTPQLVEDATRVLLPYINDDRMARIDSVLKQRTQHCRFLFENPSNPSNVWACLRTIDSFGIQFVDVVINSGKYNGKAAIAQKRGMRTAMGSAQWLSLRNHVSTEDAVRELRDVRGCKIFASDLNPDSKDIRDIDLLADDRPICIVMGNEGIGISEEMRALADETFTLPMCGFAESFNLSVATAITLAHLSAASKGGNGPLRAGDLDEHEFKCLRLKGILNSLPQKRTGKALLGREGLTLPAAIEWV